VLWHIPPRGYGILDDENPVARSLGFPHIFFHETHSEMAFLLLGKPYRPRPSSLSFFSPSSSNTPIGSWKHDPNVQTRQPVSARSSHCKVLEPVWCPSSLPLAFPSHQQVSTIAGPVPPVCLPPTYPPGNRRDISGSTKYKTYIHRLSLPTRVFISVTAPSLS